MVFLFEEAELLKSHFGLWVVSVDVVEEWSKVLVAFDFADEGEGVDEFGFGEFSPLALVREQLVDFVLGGLSDAVGTLEKFLILGNSRQNSSSEIVFFS